MTGACEFNRDFPRLMNSPTEDPFWAHVPSCPDCQAMMAAFQEFQDEAVPNDLGFDLDEADGELADRLDLDLGSPTAGISTGSQVISVASSVRWWNRKQFWYSMAAVLVAGTGIFLVGDLPTISEPQFDGDSGFVRGIETQSDQYLCQRDQGVLQFTWPEQMECDQVKIVLFDREMSEQADFFTDPGSPFQLTDPALLKTAVYGQVLHLSHGDVLQRGPLVALPLEQ